MKRSAIAIISTLILLYALASIVAYKTPQNTEPTAAEIDYTPSQVELMNTLVQQRKTIEDLKQQLDLFTDPIEPGAAEPTIYHIPLSEDLQRYTYIMCSEYGIQEHYTLVLALMWQETHFNPDQISSTDDYGIMQINICNHKWLREHLGITDFLDPYQNIKAGVYMLSTQIHKYGDLHKALMSYNFGPGGAQACWAAGIYTSEYSRAVIGKQELILDDAYNAE